MGLLRFVGRVDHVGCRLATTTMPEFLNAIDENVLLEEVEASSPPFHNGREGEDEIE